MSLASGRDAVEWPESPLISLACPFAIKMPLLSFASSRELDMVCDRDLSRNVGRRMEREDVMSSDVKGKWGAPMDWPTYPYGSGDMLQSLQLGHPM